MTEKPNLLYLGQTPFSDKLDAAPKVRTYYLHEAFKKIANVTFINGSRSSRANPLIAHLKHFPRGYYHAAYLEAATSTSTPVDIGMLYYLKKQKIPLGIFIRDLYPLFDLSPRRTLKEEVLYRAWFASQYFYQKTATVLFYPTPPFTTFFDFPHQALLPPGARKSWLPEEESKPTQRNIILYSGAMGKECGERTLFKAMEEVVKKHPETQLLVISNADCPSPWNESKWLIHIKGSLESALPYLPQIVCGVIPRPLSDYNHIAMPIKTFDYLSLGLPLLVTKCHELQSLVESDALGLCCDDNVSDMVKHLFIMLEDQERQSTGRAAVRQAVLTKHSWQCRAEYVLRELLPYSPLKDATNLLRNLGK